MPFILYIYGICLVYVKHIIDIRPLCMYLRYTTDIRLMQILTPVTLPSRYGISLNIIFFLLVYYRYIPYLDGNVTGVKILHETYIARIPEIRTKWSYINNMFDINMT